MRIKKLRRLSVITTLALVGILFLGSTSPILAATNYSDLIDDPVFDDSGSMSASQINNFLNSFSGSCISSNNGFQAPNPTGYSPSAGFTYGGNVTAGQVIYDAAAAYTINPQVLLATTQKEQSLVTGSGGCSKLGYVGAMGYGCPDSGTTHNYSGLNLYTLHGVTTTSITGTCVSDSAQVGFSQQVIHAAWLLKFDRERAEGNTGWAIVNSSWNDTDDLSTCYYGFMTQGTFARCPGGSTTYYDGYATIDSSSFQLDNGATAALYDYTPHEAGNNNFDTIFDSWFGSTSFPQPAGAYLDYQSSTGEIFLVSNNTRFYVPSWAMMTNYGLDTYPTLPVSDATIDSLTNGGTLTNLIWNSGGVYMVNNKALDHLSTQACTDWGFSCLDNTQVIQLSTVFETAFLQSGPETPSIASYGGTYYNMQNGQRDPFANTQSITASGFTPSQALNISSVNATQPTGTLLLTTPTAIKFANSQTVYYFDGTTYHVIPDPATMAAWNINSILVPPTSSYDTSTTGLPVGNQLSIWYQSGGTDYVADQGRLVKLTTAQTQLWPSATYQTFPSQLAQALPIINLQSFIWSSPNIYEVSGSEKHYVPTYSDYLSLGINQNNTTSLSPYTTASIANGNYALGNGQLVKFSEPTIYVVSNGTLLAVPSSTIFNDYGFDWNSIMTVPDGSLNEYPISGSALPEMFTNTSSGDYTYIFDGQQLSLTPQTATAFGLKTSSYQATVPTDVQPILPTSTKAVSAFLYNPDNGKIYYASGGAIHYVSTYSAFVAYGGLRTPATSVDSTYINTFLLAQPI